jgi:hypothetical protein
VTGHQRHFRANPATCLDRRGFNGVVEYVQGFGRRRPAAYFLGCAAAGFAAATILMSTASTAWSVTSRVVHGAR